jgi:hypothetical protein
VLKRFSCAAIANQASYAAPLNVGERPVKFQVKAQTLHAQDMGEQMLGVEPGTIHCMILEISGSGRENLKDRHRTVRGWAGAHGSAADAKTSPVIVRGSSGNVRLL